MVCMLFGSFVGFVWLWSMRWDLEGPFRSLSLHGCCRFVTSKDGSLAQWDFVEVLCVIDTFFIKTVCC
jgi:hypothetical protein